MISTVLETPFGRVTLSARDAAPVEATEAPPTLPPGMRLDACRASALKIAFGTGEPVEIELSADLAPGTDVDRNDGDGFVAWSVDGAGLAGAFGMRDLEGLARAHGLEVVSHANVKAGLRARLRASEPCVLTVGLAAAWTLSPSSEADELAPWIAVDRALTSQG